MDKANCRFNINKLWGCFSVYKNLVSSCLSLLEGARVSCSQSDVELVSRHAGNQEDFECKALQGGQVHDMDQTCYGEWTVAG